ncbi:MAG: sigma-70 family RNA polymerase sigma factor [Opitutaceae bacterium]
MTDDAELLRRYAKQSSEAAFAELVERHLALVYSTALRQLNGDAHLARDVAQTVFTALARKASSLSRHGSLVGWLYLGAHHAAAQAVRGERRRQAREHEVFTMNEIFSEGETSADWDRVRPVLDEAMRELAAADREAVLLRYFEQQPFAEIGDALRLSEDAARMRVDRALEKLRALLGRRGINSTAAALVAAFGNEVMVAAPAGLAVSITGTALAAGASTATATTLIAGFFMTKTTLSVIALAAVGSAVFFASHAYRSASTKAENNRELTALRAQVTAAEEILAAKKRDEAKLIEKSNASSEAIVPLPSKPASNPTVGFRFTATPPPTDAEGMRRLREDAIEGVYGALFRQLEFTPEQREQFKSIKLQMLEKGNELFGARVAGAQSSKPSPTDVKKIGEETFQEIEAQTNSSMRSAFGDEISTRLQHFEFTRPVRFLTDQLAASLFNTDTPLRPEQADQLVEIMAKLATNLKGKIDASTMNGPAVLEASQTILTPSQLPSFTRILSQQMRKQLDQERLIDRSHAPAVATP